MVANTGYTTSTPSRISAGVSISAPKKNSFPEIGLRVNGALFYYLYDDIQLTKTVPGALVVLNAAKAKIKGADVDAEYHPGDVITLTMGLSYVDGEYSRFPDGPVYIPNPAGGNFADSDDLSGNRILRSPRWSGNVGAKVGVPFASGKVTATTNVYYSGDFYWESENRLRQDSYVLVNGEVEYQPNDAPWRVWLYGRNLTNKKYSTYSESGATGDLLTAAPGRLVGVGCGVKF